MNEGRVVLHCLVDGGAGTVAVLVADEGARTDEGCVSLLNKSGIPLRDDAVVGVVFSSDAALTISVEFMTLAGAMLVAVKGVRKERVYLGGTLCFLRGTDTHAIPIADVGARMDEISLGGTLLCLRRVGDVLPCADTFPLLIANERARKDETSLGGALLFLCRIGDHADILVVRTDEAPKVVLSVSLLFLEPMLGQGQSTSLNITAGEVRAKITVVDRTDGTMTTKATRRTLRVTLRSKCVKLNLSAAAWKIRAEITIMDRADWLSVAVDTGRTFDLTLG